MIVALQDVAVLGLHQDALEEYIGKHGALAETVPAHALATDVTTLKVQAAEHIMLK
jgi:hypothetical protein